MNNLYTLKVYPAGLGRTVYRVIEIAGNETLDKLCETILDAYDFTYDHLYEFCMDNKMYGRNSYQCEPMEGESSTKTAIDEIWLSKGQNFSLHYDFGDDWMFTIHVQKIEEVQEYKEPKVIKEKGQIEQYPDYEDEEYDEFFDEDFED
ncbi:MAG: plasmid pRiA4b ORF-3 family protein [Lachnospiraceae bacterium]|nr:plasmid pRiA4b ORF-3 family protein [Lachnospiraceae bacterium]